jgi:large subunit ribosomal protein L23
MVSAKPEIKEAKVEKKAAQPTKSPAATSNKGRAEANVDAWSIIIHPLLTEKSIAVVESQNKLTFNVRPNSTKKQIKWAIENALAVKVGSVNTLIDRQGRKRATVTLAKGFKAADIATRFGML